jgi:hypothetical protein
VKCGASQLCFAVGDVVIGVRCAELPFGIFKVEVSSDRETKVGHDELVASGQDVVEMSVEVHNAMCAHLVGCTEQLIQNPLSRTRHFLSAGGQLGIQPAARHIGGSVDLSCYEVGIGSRLEAIVFGLSNHLGMNAKSAIAQQFP